MPELDELLEQELQALENGRPLQSVLAELPQEAGELAALIRLVSDIRALPYPQPATAMTPEQLSISAGEATRPIPHRAHPNGHMPLPQSRLKLPHIRLDFPKVRLGWVIASAGAAFLMLFAMAALFSLSAGRVRAATVMDIRGIARVTIGKAAGDWTALQEGAKVHQGQRLLTGPDSNLTLVFYEGSRMTLGPNSYVVLNELEGGWGNALRLVVTQSAGKTSHSVVPLKGTRSTYQVITPAGVASVHGTRFSVAVGQGGIARFAVNTGKVIVRDQQAELALEAGQAAAAAPGALPDSPDYQLNLSGALTSLDGDTWTVNGVSFTTGEGTQLMGELQAGKTVRVEGRLTGTGERLADSVAQEDGDQTESTLTGILQSIQGDTWMVDGTAIHVGTETKLGEGIELGMPVKVEFYVASDGRWIATEIEALVEEEEPIPTESPVVTGTITPTGSITPTDSATPTPFTTCTGANPQPKGQKLAREYGVDYGEIMGWFCQHFGFGEIDLAYGLSRQYSISVEQIFALRRSGLGWGQIKQMLAAGLVTPTPVITPTETLTTTLVPTTTATITITVTPTGTLVTPTPLPAKNDRNCPKQDNPTGSRLAAQYGVPLEEIMGWFCRGFGFGEIDKAYSMSREYGIAVAEIFNMRASGLGWGQIKQLLSASTPVPMVTPQPGNGNGNGNNPARTPPGHRNKPPKPPKP